MGKIFYLMGKSASGKDSIYEALKNNVSLGLCSFVLYTTRPIRSQEVQGVEYHFVDDKRFGELLNAGKIIEFRTYQTIYGTWTYFTADDGQIDLGIADYLGIGTLESYEKLKEYYGDEAVCPVYIEVEDGERLKRAIRREEQQQVPKYEEMCRRFLADAKDFSEENLCRAGIAKRFENKRLSDCLREIEEYIGSVRNV